MWWFLHYNKVSTKIKFHLGAFKNYVDKMRTFENQQSLVYVVIIIFEVGLTDIKRGMQYYTLFPPRYKHT